MKKMIALVLCLVVCCGLCACENAGYSTLENDSVDSSSSSNYYSSQIENAVSSKDNSSKKEQHIHSYSSATCTSPKKCSCGATQGSALGHNFSKATCTSLAKCSRCGVTNGNLAKHNFSTGKCTVCGASDPNALPSDTKQDIITNLDQAINDLEGSWESYSTSQEGGFLSEQYYSMAVTLAKRAAAVIGIAHTYSLSYPNATLSDGRYVKDAFNTLKQITDLLATNPSDEAYTKVVDFVKQIRSQI